MKSVRVFILAASVVLAGCGANHHSIYRHQSLVLPNLTSLDAKQRVVLAAQSQSRTGSTQSIFCAEPSPDVFAVIAQSISGGASFGKSADPKTLQAALSAAFGSAEQGSNIPRTQTTNMLREMMYRTCERYLSGGISDIELALQAVRDQRLMVSILAIEQLTGVVHSAPIRIGVTAGGSSSAVEANAAIRLDEQHKRVQQKNDMLKTKQTAYDALNASNKQCEKLAVGADEGSLKEEEKNKHHECRTAFVELEKAKQEQEAAQAHYTQLTHALTGGTTTTVAGALDAVPAIVTGVNGQNSETLMHVASTVKDIVSQTFDQDEFLLLCIKVLYGKNEDGNENGKDNINIEKNCLTYIQSKVELEEERGKLAREEIEEARQKIQLRNDDLFEQFWRRISKNDQLNPTALGNAKKYFDENHKGRWPNCLDSANTKDTARDCFNRRTLVADTRRKLAQGGW